MVIIYMRGHAITRNKERRIPLQKLKNIMHFLTIDIDLYRIKTFIRIWQQKRPILNYYWINAILMKAILTFSKNLMPAYVNNPLSFTKPSWCRLRAISLLLVYYPDSRSYVKTPMMDNPREPYLSYMLLMDCNSLLFYFWYRSLRVNILNSKTLPRSVFDSYTPFSWNNSFNCSSFSSYVFPFF